MECKRLIVRDCVMEPDISIGKQLEKVIEEFDEVTKECLPVGDRLGYNAGGTVKGFTLELLDVKLAIDNLLIKMEESYGDRYMDEIYCLWNNKINYYKEVKYKK